MDKKDDYRRKIEAQLKEWNLKIEELKAKSEKLGAEARMEYAEQIEGLRKRRDGLKKKLNEMREDSDEAWDVFRTGMEKAMREFSTGLSQAVAIFREKTKKRSDSGDRNETVESDVCLRAEVPEHARFDNDDMGCDDGREGKSD